MSEDRWAVLIDRLTSVPMIVFYIILLAGVFGVLNPDTLHRVSADLKGLFR